MWKKNYFSWDYHFHGLFHWITFPRNPSQKKKVEKNINNRINKRIYVIAYQDEMRSALKNKKAERYREQKSQNKKIEKKNRNLISVKYKLFCGFRMRRLPFFFFLFFFSHHITPNTFFPFKIQFFSSLLQLHLLFQRVKKKHKTFVLWSLRFLFVFFCCFLSVWSYAPCIHKSLFSWKKLYVPIHSTAIKRKRDSEKSKYRKS